MKNIQRIKFLSLLVFIFATSTLMKAQTDEISKTDLMKFQRAQEQIEKANAKFEKEQQKALQMEGLTESEFNQLQRSRANASKEKIEAYNRLSPLMNELQQNHSQNVEKYISESGLDRMQYKMIESQYKTNPDLKKRSEKMRQ